MKQKKEKLGIMGGTFDPIHIGHLMLAEWAKEAASLDRILFIPAGSPYMKGHVTEGAMRLQMVQKAIQKNPSFESCGMEIERQGKTYTYETVERLQKEYPDSELYFIMGADCLFSIENWREPQRIFQGCKVIAAARNGSSLDRMKEKQKELMTRFHADILLLSFPAVDISSTEIRRRVLKGESVRYMVPDEVNDNILKYHLYQSEVQ